MISTGNLHKTLMLEPTWIWAPINNDIVQYLEVPVRFVCIFIRRLLADQLIYKISSHFAILILGSHNSAFESKSQAYYNTVSEGIGQGFTEFFVIELC